jgi:twitching motility protein PilT
MQVGQTRYGMQTMNRALCSLFVRRIVTLEEALSRSHDVEELKTLISSAQSGAPGAPRPKR